jgi:hypothetical protein
MMGVQGEFCVRGLANQRERHPVRSRRAVVSGRPEPRVSISRAGFALCSAFRYRVEFGSNQHGMRSAWPCR